MADRATCDDFGEHHDVQSHGSIIYMLRHIFNINLTYIPLELISKDTQVGTVRCIGTSNHTLSLLAEYVQRLYEHNMFATKHVAGAPHSNLYVRLSTHS